MFTPDQIAQATGDDAGLIAQYWPEVLNGLVHFGISDHATRVVAVATVAVECDWRWLTELADGSAYEWRADLGNSQPGDGPRFKGRGFVQITGRGGYTAAGNALGVDLVNHPELAAEPHIAGLTLGLYFKTHNLQGLANAGDYPGCRRAVNGGETGIARFLAVINALLALPEPPDAAPAAPVTTVTIPTILRTVPKTNGRHAINPQHQPVVLSVGTQIHFTPDTSPGQYHGLTTTDHWAHVVVASGPIHGWMPRSSLVTQ